MKELELTCTLRNNRLRERRQETGWTVDRICREIGICTMTYYGLESMRVSPKRTDGRWTGSAQKLSVFFRVCEEELFPSIVLRVQKRKVVRKIDAEESELLLSDHHEHLLMPVDEQADAAMIAKMVSSGDCGLTSMEREVLVRYYGLSECPEENVPEIANNIGVHKSRVSQLLRMGLRRIRRFIESERRAEHEPST